MMFAQVAAARLPAKTVFYSRHSFQAIKPVLTFSIPRLYSNLPQSQDKDEYESVNVPPLRRDTTSPQVYGRIKQILASTMSVTAGLDSTPDHIEALKRAQLALRKNKYPRIPEEGEVIEARPNYLSRLAADGGNKILRLKHSYIHVDFTRFIELCTNIQADITARDGEVILSKEIKQKFLRGRGRYGATPHIKTALLKIVLQEREKPFDVRHNDPLEWIRCRLRKVHKEFTPSAEELYTKIRKECPVKPIYV
ncbi:hypothetical protein BATDEDRAFT_86037 [Batrachochytrium dendrobatidis JAM81]|uniref:Uncharacterized protein n=1 Tax=Batrachochytrium dendrobatidis (strain JAM81 / FGSC 10211) TaxID=684364 RepID=F4NUT2_BATDJ|nr:uncharacterized protein BATDEDRAFT_86037 [Batrachochytrium dendrobatidis JAM81]EGF83636.1 hypothetical protein BATDEDRAFT_86037 [Batrachochytrium dendrobatidis JAM81]|eukprot:XP_006676166.1 hypothetical protein BATDEDRAFT_86037 [Batrachochytrium dendrobatidis JAM81]